MKTYQFTQEQFDRLHITIECAVALLADYMQYEDDDEDSLEQVAYRTLLDARDILDFHQKLSQG